MHACLTGRMVFSDYTKKSILFYHAKGYYVPTIANLSNARSITHFAYICSCSFQLSRSTALQVMASTLDHAQLLDYTQRGVRRYLKSTTDTCVVRSKILIVTRVVCTYVKRNGPCTVRYAQLLDYTQRGVRRYLKSTTDTCVVRS